MTRTEWALRFREIMQERERGGDVLEAASGRKGAASQPGGRSAEAVPNQNLNDPSHDFAHFDRVVRTALELAQQEGAHWQVVLPAAWFHDLVNYPKNHPNRSQSSRESALVAVQVLEKMGYPAEWHSPIAQAIESHSFSAGLEAKSLEAKIVQDADRLDALGAIGIARCFATANAMQSKFYDPLDPFASRRPLDDRAFALDHFFLKLFRLGDMMQTNAGQREALRRIAGMRRFIEDFSREIQWAPERDR